MRQPEDPIDRLRERIRVAPGGQVLGQLRIYYFSYYTFLRNYRSLERWIDEATREGAPLDLWDRKNRNRLDQAHQELVCRLHNFLAGSKSLVDHTRYYVSRLYSEHSFRGEYQDEVNRRFANSGITKFVEDLRNWVLHWGVPPVGLSPSFKFRQEIHLHTPTLLKWDGWSAISRQFIRSLPEKYPLSEMVREYGTTVTSFHEWFNATIREIHKDEIAEYLRLGRELEEAYQSNDPNDDA